MRLGAYKATGYWLTAMRKLLGVDLRITGEENLVDRPTLFVANHFTRIETFLVPYAIFYSSARPVRSLGTHTIFRGLAIKYLDAVGTMSTHDPHRNRTIIRELMTGEFDWVIYPEGAMVKNKKTVRKGRLQLERPKRQGPPHTGAAVLALKAQIAKQRFLKACDAGDEQKIAFYRQAYGIEHANEISTDDIVMTPITMTFYPMRPSKNLFNKIASLISRNIDPRTDEELQVDGAILLSDTQIDVHFGKAIEVKDFLHPVTTAARRVAGLFSESRRSELMLGRDARRLTDTCMRAIYNGTEINLDHLFCYALRAMRKDEIDVEDFRRAVYLAAAQLTKAPGIRLHASLQSGITALLHGSAFNPLEGAEQLARNEGILRKVNQRYIIDRQKLQAKHDFHNVRLKGMVQVIANELEPITTATQAITQTINLPTAKLKERVASTLQRRDIRRFHRDHEKTFEPEISKPIEVGEPFLLEAPGNKMGVVLVHGYLASPEQVRTLAQYLHAHGCSVYAVRLEGHGTSPKQLTSVSWHEWMDSVMRGYRIIKQRCHNVVIGGISLGGALAMIAAARDGIALEGVFSINAPLRLRDRRAKLIPAIVNFNGALRKLGLRDDYAQLPNFTTKHPDTNYEVDYLTGVRQLRLAVRACRRRLPQVKAPALVIQSDEDPIVMPDSAQFMMRRLGSQTKIFAKIASDRHVVIRGDGCENVLDKVERFITRIVANSSNSQYSGDQRKAAG